MTGYTPGEQPDVSSVIKLNTNENPYPPSEAVMAALQSVTGEMLRKYPPPMATGFRQAAAKAHGVAAENIIATNAGDELLRLAITTFVEPGRPIGTAEPSYSLYPVLADIHGSPTVTVSLNGNWSLPDDFAHRMNDQGVQLTFVVNPHAPSGALRSVEQLSKLAEALNGVLLVDEAYVDFVDPRHGYDSVELIRRHDNVLILRTLSKGYSLAGLRFGYGIASGNIIEPMLTKTKDSYNTDAVAQRLATAAIESRDEASKTWAAVRNERARMVRELYAMGLPTPASESNFVLTTVPADRAGGAKAVYETLKRRNIFVRYFDQDRLRDKLRITIGTADQNTALLGALREIV